MTRFAFPALLVLLIPCVSVADNLGSIFDGTPIEDTPIDPGTHNPFKWIPKQPAHGSTFGVDPNYSSEITLKNYTGTTLMFDVDALQRGYPRNQLARRTVPSGGSTTWSGIPMRDITLLSITGRAPGSSVVSISQAVRPTNRRTKSFGGGGVSPGSVVISQDVVLTSKVDTIVDFSGDYNSNKGFLRLAQNGNHVNGIVTYPNGNKGVISGRVRGNRLEYQWQNASLNGTGVLTMNADRRSASGMGSDNRGTRFTWNLHKRQ